MAAIPSSHNQKPNDTWTIKAALDWTVEYLTKHGDEHPRLSAEWLLGDATGLSRVEVYAYFDRPLSVEERARLRETIVRRAKGEPLQYVSGETAFRHIIVKAQSGVLIPRPETELLVELGISLANQVCGPEEARILEVGTGTGCIALSLAKERPHTSVVATDVSPVALELAQRNCCALSNEEADLNQCIEFIQADVADSLDTSYNHTFHLLISNPPYIPTSELEALPREVSEFEPHLALDGGADGLDIFRKILEEGRRLLVPGGKIACELHENTLRQAHDLCVKWYQDVEIHQDLTGRDRFITASLKEEPYGQNVPD